MTARTAHACSWESCVAGTVGVALDADAAATGTEKPLPGRPRAGERAGRLSGGAGGAAARALASLNSGATAARAITAAHSSNDTVPSWLTSRAENILAVVSSSRLLNPIASCVARYAFSSAKVTLPSSFTSTFEKMRMARDRGDSS